MALIFVPRETEPGESRVAATPETVKGYTKLGLEVTVARSRMPGSRRSGWS